jgi:hypothetical protein
MYKTFIRRNEVGHGRARQEQDSAGKSRMGTINKNWDLMTDFYNHFTHLCEAAVGDNSSSTTCIGLMGHPRVYKATALL